MINIFIIVLLLVGLFLLAQKYVLKGDKKDYQYKKRGPALSAVESTFYHALVQAVGQHGIVFCKTSMANLVTPVGIRRKRDYYIASNRINKNLFQFVICDPRTFEPRVVVELDDGKPLTKSKSEREKLLLHVCKTTNLPLIGANVKLSYQVSKLRRLLAAHIDLIEAEQEIRFCKRCGSPMNIKIASQGEHKGRRFFTCSRQPHCTYTENYNVLFDDIDDIRD
jgi:ssDNA-binding Zn-finger/Zn-ribbon topoisomerase 1